MKAQCILLVMIALCACNKAENKVPEPARVDQRSLEDLGGGFGLDRAAGKIYYDGQELLDADPATFLVLAYLHAKDQNQAYVGFRRIEGADAGTFSYIAGRFSKDKNSIYSMGLPFKEADVASFVDVKPRKASDLHHSPYFKDRNTVFDPDGRDMADSSYVGTPVDPNTFVYYGGPFMGIHGKVYFQFRETLDVDAATFEFLECHSLPRYGLDFPKPPPISCSASANGQTIVREF